MREYKDLLDWECISMDQTFSEKFIIEHLDLVDWSIISSCQKLSENFMREYKDLLDWKYISRCQKLSENFMREHKDLLDWKYISQYKNLSEKTIAKCKNLVYWDLIFDNNQELSEKFILKFAAYFGGIHINKYRNKSHLLIKKLQKQLKERRKIADFRPHYDQEVVVRLRAEETQDIINCLIIAYGEKQ